MVDRAVSSIAARMFPHAAEYRWDTWTAVPGRAARIYVLGPHPAAAKKPTAHLAKVVVEIDLFELDMHLQMQDPIRRKEKRRLTS